MEELPITVDENNFEVGTREILRNIRPKWAAKDIKFKVSVLSAIKILSADEEEDSLLLSYKSYGSINVTRVVT